MNAEHPPGDPKIDKLPTCIGRSGRACGAPMGPVRVYQGLGDPSRRSMRGSIVQTCPKCRWTHYHTPPYIMEDAERLLIRFNYPGDPRGLPATLHPPTSEPLTPPRTQVIPAQTQPNTTMPANTPSLLAADAVAHSRKLLCAVSTCVTKSGGRTSGNDLCIQKLCLSCCRKAYDLAETSGMQRSRCKVHKQDSLHGNIPVVQAPVTEAVAQEGISTTIIDQGLAAVQPVIADNPEIAVVARQHLRPQPVPNIPPPAAPKPSGLARTIAPDWEQAHNVASQKRQSVKSMKIQQHNMDEQQKRTCILVLYYSENEEPVRLDHYVPSFPDLQLSAHPELAEHLGLNKDAYLDFWNGEWITIRLNSVLQVNKGQRILLKLRENLRKPLNDAACLGLAEELVQQRNFKNAPIRGPKRMASNELVSPIRKIAPLEPTSKFALVPSKLAGASAVDAQEASLALPISGCVSEPVIDLSAKPGRKENIQNLQKRWPHDFYVYEVHNGLLKINTLLKKGGGRRKFGAITKKSAFLKAFPGAQYVKTTFWKYEKIWNNSDFSVRQLFIDLGESDQALFASFLQANEDPELLPDPQDGDLNDNESSSGSSDESPDFSVKPGTPDKGKAKAMETIIIPARSPSPDSLNRPSSPDLLNIPLDVRHDQLPRRVRDLQDVIAETLLDPIECEFFRAEVAKNTAIFQVINSAGPSFSQETQYKGQAAYYGERGFTFVMETLTDMFPETDAHHYSDELKHLSWNQILEKVLLPETIILLVQEDMRISRQACITIIEKCHSMPSSNEFRVKEQDISNAQIDPALRPVAPVIFPGVIDSTSNTAIVKIEESSSTSGSFYTLADHNLPTIIDLTGDSDSE